MTHHWVTSGLLLVAVFVQSHAQLNISTSTPTPCYGDVVTLVCHHPELASNPGKYFDTEPTWRENGRTIPPIRGTMFEANTAVEPTHTNLTMSITRDYFRNESFNYSCLLVLAGDKELQTGGVESSEEVTVDPLDQPGPPEVTITTTDSTITLTWNTTLRCFESEMFTFIIIWNEIGSGTSTNVTTSSSPYTISGLQLGTSYQISVRGVGGLGVVSEARVLTVQTPKSPTGDNLSFVLVVTIPIVSVVILIGVGLAISRYVVPCLKKADSGDYDMRSSEKESNHPTPCNAILIHPPSVEVVTNQITVADEEKDREDHPTSGDWYPPTNGN